ncbi:L-Ala-D/L-Glu epimerase [Yersinia kristensenii]|uniref:Dipeptide epimerase n=1 Tax=Yersinia kristensenii TaxID=28152 RepID=A0AB73NJK4_YERKR|nr:L-Ala-D/L-Glu epimerase [Yersinia kristensenii]MDA5474639.1 L-Ala-D/L-Glu epimerase [Yersinia kristensenii]MDA5478807.1 L-Ala-D/L-Glu epimerase [Yersinia kristensenii]MDA5505479.1 L-Ala-D/L-Glu epimerase [Yersinia kristensenii]NIK94367.1 L-Ala-D/L-Glu epimerase [Yersinia kristensenii]NIL05721.1 L-Ala-D/L-Glu epimerase [Yersinia kristensenii]
MRTMRCYPESWPLHSAFVISRGSRNEAKVVVVEIEEAGIRAVGECTPYPHYGESESSVMAQLALVLGAIEQGVSRETLQQLLPAGAARNAVDCALWQLECLQSQQSLWHMTQTAPILHLSMAQTVSIGTPEAMAYSASALANLGANLLKIKLDDHLIAERLVAIRSAAPDAILIVDANESWRPEGLAARCQLLADLGVAMLEQPLPAGQDDSLQNFIHPLPICADESCHTRADLAGLVGRYEMVNIKLDKSGGLTEALLLAEQAKSLGFAIMLGCMLCTSRAIRAALPLAPGARFVDLDGPTWLQRDVDDGLHFSTGAIDLSA